MGRDHEHVSRDKKKKKRTSSLGDERVEKDSTHRKKHKKTRQSLRQREKRQKEEFTSTKRPHSTHNTNSCSGDEEEEKAHVLEETMETDTEVPKSANHYSPSENRNKPRRRRSSSDKNASFEAKEETADEESEHRGENEESDADENRVPARHKSSSSDSKKRHSMKKSKHKKKPRMNRSFGAADRKLRSSRRSERNSEAGKKEQSSENDQADMYTIVKRERKRIKRDMYGMPVLDKEVSRESRRKDDFIREDDEADEEEDRESRDGEDEEEEEMEDEESSEDSENSGSDDSSAVDRSYNLRKHRKPTNFYMKSQLEALQKWGTSRLKERAREKNGSCSEEEEDDDDVFDRARNRNIRKKFLPINMRDIHLNAAGDAEQSLLIDKSVTFSSIGGLDRHIMSLREMVIFPFLYPEFFQRFKIRAPKGVLFHGPPGTGKTLLARALANECSHGNRKVAFFLRKGSDCLSKWVGESEKQIRILFDQAHQMKPSIIFFDEIDGLIPVRSGKQDQVHNSIVSTLLALMDGLDDRGEVMVVGSTNRIDSVDPAFRRPGRFDRELLFPLPTKEGRDQILRICARDWSPGLSDDTIEYLASQTDGYSGADLKGLCSEAALIALRRRYPQIFLSKEKLAINVQEINISLEDFALAMRGMVPSARRSFAPVAKILPPLVRPLLERKLEKVMDTLEDVFPAEALRATYNLSVGEGIHDVPCQYNKGGGGARISADLDVKLPYSFGSFSGLPPVCRPRILICGRPGQGQTCYFCPAILQRYEGLPVHVVDLVSSFSGEMKSPAEFLCHTLQQCVNCAPCILYMPNVDLWWRNVEEVATVVLTSSLEHLNSTVPLLVLASSSVPYEETPAEIRTFFNDQYYEMDQTTHQERTNFFHDLILKMPCVKPVRIKERVLEKLPVAPLPERPVPSGEELEQVRRNEEGVLRRWRRFLRSTINKLNTRKEFNEFRKPVDDTEVPDYYEIVSKPMDLATMMSKVDLNRYKSGREFLDDVDLIYSNALDYNPVGDPKSRKIRGQVRHFKDFAYNLLDETLDCDLERQCQNVHKDRLSRGENLEQLEIQEFNIVTNKEVVRTKEDEDATSETKEGAQDEGEDRGSSDSGTRTKDEKARASNSLEEELEKESRRRRNKKRKVSERNERKKRPQSLNSSDDEAENEPPNKRSKTRITSSSSSSSSGATPVKSRKAPSNTERTPSLSPDEDRPADVRPVAAEEREEPTMTGEEEEEENTEEEEEDEEPELVVDEKELESILIDLVRVTRNSTVNELIHVHVHFERAIYRHKDEYDKTQLIKDMKNLSRSSLAGGSGSS